MITAQRCATFAGLASSEVFLGASPSSQRRAMLFFYLQSVGRRRLTPKQLREIIVADLRIAVSCGAAQQAADLLNVLREVFSLFPEASLTTASAPSKRHRHRPPPLADYLSKFSSRGGLLR